MQRETSPQNTETLSRTEMTAEEHAIRRLSRIAGYFVLRLPFDLWEFSREGEHVTTKYCSQAALDWISSRAGAQA